MAREAVARGGGGESGGGRRRRRAAAGVRVEMARAAAARVGGRVGRGGEGGRRRGAVAARVAERLGGGGRHCRGKHLESTMGIQAALGQVTALVGGWRRNQAHRDSAVTRGHLARGRKRDPLGDDVGAHLS